MSRIRFRGRSKAFQTVSSSSFSSEDWDHFEPIMLQALARVPALEKAGIKQLINGPESFTPDGNFILGEAPEVRGFYVGAGFNAFGIASAGGAGRALAEWIAAGEPPMDLWPVDIRRFGRHHRSETWVRTRTLEAYAKHYTMAWPFEEYRSARPLRVSPLYPRLKDQGACFGEKLGWERPNWFAPPGVEPKDIYTYGRQNWFALRRYRAPGLPRARRAVRSDQLRQVPADRQGRRTGPAVDLRQRRRQTAGESHVHADVERARGNRVRSHRRETVRNRVLHCYRHGVRHSRLRLDSTEHPAGLRGRSPGRRHVGLLRAGADGPASARRTDAGDSRGLVQCGLPVRRMARDRRSLARWCARSA